MERQKAIRELPLYAEADIPKVNVYQRRKMFDSKAFARRYGIAMIAMAAFTIYTVLLSAWVDYRAEKRVWAEANVMIEARMAEYDRQQQEAQSAERFLSGEASLEAAISDLAEPLAEHIASLRMDRGVTVDGAKTYVWGVDLSRLASGRYGSTIREVLRGNIEGYVEGHAVRNEDREIAMEIARAYIKGERPDYWTPDLEFAEINADGSVTARNQLFTNSTTMFWRFKG